SNGRPHRFHSQIHWARLAIDPKSDWICLADTNKKPTRVSTLIRRHRLSSSSSGSQQGFLQ
ncbi:hypothetical protein KUCAC02_007044, partial [Chaenocephalus aceratus]